MVLAKLWYTGLAKVYKLFFLYLVSDFLSSIAALSIPYDTKLYGYAYISLQTLKIGIAAMALVEIYGLAMARTPALAAFGRRTVGYFLAAAALLPLAAAYLDHAPTSQPILRAYLLFERTLDATIALFLILISIFLGWFPIQLRRNVVIYIVGFIVWFLSRSTGLHLVIQRAGNRWMSSVINAGETGVTIACLLLWMICLRPEWEGLTTVVGHLWNKAEAGRLTEQLDAINDGLDRLRRR